MLFPVLSRLYNLAIRIPYPAIIFLQLIFLNAGAQDSFNYIPQLEPVIIKGLPGIHSYAYAQHDGKWLIIGGRIDGIHARQPFNAFPARYNNYYLFVIDPVQGKFWKDTLKNVPLSIKEQLSSTNMEFVQDKNTLYLAGGYGYSVQKQDHITYPYLTAVPVAETINAIIHHKPIKGIIQKSDSVFAVTGGRMVKTGDDFLLVGGHKFDGRYNPMLGPTFTQTYTNAIRKFRLKIVRDTISVTNYTEIKDPDHLHRRDFNIIPRILPSGNFSYMIASGVFQYNYDLPYLYPVIINPDSVTPVKSFNQFLNHYHCANVTFYHPELKQAHTVFFGGMSQYYFQNGKMIQDNDVPFVNTISLLTADSNYNFTEYEFNEKMAGLKGAASEFILNTRLSLKGVPVIELKNNKDTIEAGYIYGGLNSISINPFANNSHEETNADTLIYKVRFIRRATQKRKIDGNNPFSINAKINYESSAIDLDYNSDRPADVSYIITSGSFDLVAEDTLPATEKGFHHATIPLKDIQKGNVYNLTVVFDNMYYEGKQLIAE